MEVVGGRPQGLHYQNSIWVLFDHNLFPQSEEERISTKLAVEIYLFLLVDSARLFPRNHLHRFVPDKGIRFHQRLGGRYRIGYHCKGVVLVFLVLFLADRTLPASSATLMAFLRQSSQWRYPTKEGSSNSRRPNNCLPKVVSVVHLQQHQQRQLRQGEHLLEQLLRVG